MKKLFFLMIVSNCLWAISFGTVISVFFQNKITEQAASIYSLFSLVITSVLASEKIQNKLLKVENFKKIMILGYILQLLGFISSFAVYKATSEALYYFIAMSCSYYPLAYVNFRFFKIQLNKKIIKDELSKIEAKFDKFSIVGQFLGFSVMFVLSIFGFVVHLNLAIFLFIVGFLADLVFDVSVLKTV